MFQVAIRSGMGMKKAPNSGEGWALLRFHAYAGREAGAEKLVPSARRGGTTDGDWHQLLNIARIPRVGLDANEKDAIKILTVANMPQIVAYPIFFVFPTTSAFSGKVLEVEGCYPLRHFNAGKTAAGTNAAHKANIWSVGVFYSVCVGSHKALFGAVSCFATSNAGAGIVLTAAVAAASRRRFVHSAA